MRWDEIVYGQIALGMTNRTISDRPIFMISSIVSKSDIRYANQANRMSDLPVVSKSNVRYANYQFVWYLTFIFVRYLTFIYFDIWRQLILLKSKLDEKVATLQKLATEKPKSMSEKETYLLRNYSLRIEQQKAIYQLGERTAKETQPWRVVAQEELFGL